MQMRRRWQVRWWIRGVGIAAILILFSQQFSTIYFVGRGEMSASEVPLGWIALAVLTTAVGLLAFRPYIELAPDGVLILQGPLRRHTYHRDDLRDVSPTAWGLRFTFGDGSHRTSIVCQDTYSLYEPRWFDVAEAATGRRPIVLEGNEDDWE
ncbi:hypothetical protein AL755_03165 (plasmid) [Arthrobacter sp. ERGS1:01]|nr:hypothetical protein AL755_03165 [Arthrobacter sp. ERGS1:01]